MMPSSTSTCDLRELACLLRQERLFIKAEQESVEQLSAAVANLSSDLNQALWLAAQHRRNLQLLVLARQDCLPALQAQRGYAQDIVRFLDAPSIVGYTEAAAYGEFLVHLRDSPELLAGCLASGDKLHPEMVHGVLHALCTGVYGSCVLSIDKRLVLKLLEHLAILQLSPSDNPRRLLRHGTCAFARLYNIFHENLHSAQIFLTAALHGPIMALLAEDEIFLDVDPEKSSLRCSTDGPTQQRRHRDWTVQRLVSLTELFINGIQDHINFFPPGVSWLLRRLVAMFNKTGFLNEKEIYEICTDMLLTHFICPAIVNPEPHGIIEAPVSDVARFNLMQVASILQVLAMSKYEDWDPKVADLYSQFHHDCVSRIITSIVEGGTDVVDGPAVRESDMEGVTRTTALLTTTQLNLLISFLQTIATSETDCFDKHLLENMISNLPPVATNGHKETGSKTKQADPGRRPGLLSKATRNRTQTNGETNDDLDMMEPVLVIRLAGETDSLEILPETKVLEMEEKQVVPPTLCVVDGQVKTTPLEVNHSHEKRTRFSLSHDEGSIGNTSDNLEAISEAASNHSGASSLESENEDQNDNLSDMVSANVSGRGSPNISGRDTPSSQITEGEAPDRPPPTPRPVIKQTRSDIDDKFGKFEIRKQDMGDETVSLVSDTWSTDVLASDSETVEQSDRFARPIDEGPPHPFIQHSLDISETASEAWSTDVMASDSERLTEVDTDDTASVAPSDDTAPSEPGEMRHRCEEPFTPPPATFRPLVKPEEGPRFSLAVPPSPTRCPNDAASANVTGRGGGKAEYKRRTLEFVGGLSKPGPLPGLESPRMIHVMEKLDGGGPVPNGRIGIARPIPRSSNILLPHASDTFHLESSLSSLSLTNHVDSSAVQAGPSSADSPYDEATPPASFHNAFQPVPSASFGLPGNFLGESKAEEGDRNVFVSSTSLASSSSSGSNAAPNPPLDSKNSAMGVIPKSISFDKTADKDFSDDKKQKKGFFGNLKMSFKNRRFRKGEAFDENGAHMRPRRQLSEDSRILNGDVDDILAKYRGKAAEEPDHRIKRTSNEMEEENGSLSDESIFINAKRKLRIVFSRGDIQAWPANAVTERDLITFLQLQLAEARSMQNRDLVSQLHETLRCVKLFDSDGWRRLVAGLRNDLAARSAYSRYLTHARQVLLSRAAHLNRLIERVTVETRLCMSFLLAYCVRLFLERRENRFRRFSLEFRSLSLADEKMDLLDSFLNELSAEMDRDPIWQGVSELQRTEALSAFETTVLNRVYHYAFYPNGDGDVSRDQVFYDHVKKLAAVITPNHKDLQIPKRFHGECPWPSAQADITSLASYKTPRDKVVCVTRCAATIMNLLSLASEGSVPAADEFLPVLVYVIIAANPPALLSTVQYVDSFSSRLTGEDQYWWTQFCSAIELIKTMDYNV